MKLSTGKTIDANQGIIGIDEDLDVYEGYDGHIPLVDYDWDPEGPHELTLTAEERRELSALMVDRWTRFGRLTDEEVLLR